MPTTNIQITERKFNIGDEREFLMTSLVQGSTIKANDIIAYIAQISGFREGEIKAVLYAFIDQLIQRVLNGHSIEMGDLGNLILKIKASAQDDVKDVNAASIKGARIHFSESKKTKQAFKTISQYVVKDVRKK